MPRDPLVFGHPTRLGIIEDLRAPRLRPRRSLPTDAGNGIEIDAQLVGVVEVARACRVRVEVDAAEVDDPRELRGVGDDDLVGGAAGGKAQGDGLHPVGPLLGRALLEEGRARSSIDEALEGHRAIRDASNGPVGDGHVVANEIDLGVALFGEEDLARVGHDDLASRDREDLRAVLHATNFFGTRHARKG